MMKQKKAYDLQIVTAKENLKLGHGWLSLSGFDGLTFLLDTNIAY